MQIKGIHHITAVATGAALNYRFYTRVLGLRLVKQTVNFDDPTTYHLYYGDHAGTPGTILTFFPWEKMRRGRPGTGEISAVAYSIPRDALFYWEKRLADFQLPFQRVERFGERLIRLADPHGMPLELVEVESPPGVQLRPDGPIPADYEIRGFHSAAATLKAPEPTARLLTEVMGMQIVGRESDRTRFAMSAGGSPGILLDVVVDRNLPPAQLGGGSVHHIAFRAGDDDEQLQWQSAVSGYGLQVTPVIDRNYFRSIYFREAGGILFEIATDPPGFSIDEPLENLGRDLKLPGQYEPDREKIQRHLPTLHETSGFEHIHIPGRNPDETADTLVPLHGTGGSEKDLLTLAWEIFGEGAAVISPRGRILENGMPRFFRRLSEGVFDENDVKHQAHALADFLVDAARHYDLHSSRLTALGYSNGANIAAAVMLLRPDVFSRTILMRPMLPLVPQVMPDLSGLRVLITRGDSDAVIPAEGTDRLIGVLQRCGAAVDVVTIDAGHQLTGADIQAARRWLRQSGAAGRKAVA